MSVGCSVKRSRFHRQFQHFSFFSHKICLSLSLPLRSALRVYLCMMKEAQRPHRTHCTMDFVYYCESLRSIQNQYFIFSIVSERVPDICMCCVCVISLRNIQQQQQKQQSKENMYNIIVHIEQSVVPFPVFSLNCCCMGVCVLFAASERGKKSEIL